MSASPSAHSKRLTTASHDQEPMSGTPTLRDEPVDVPLQERSGKHLNPEAQPDKRVAQKYPAGSSANSMVRTQTQSVEGDSDTEVLIVDWDGPNDPENPKKCVLHLSHSYDS